MGAAKSLDCLLGDEAEKVKSAGVSPSVITFSFSFFSFYCNDQVSFGYDSAKKSKHLMKIGLLLKSIYFGQLAFLRLHNIINIE